MYGRLVLLHHVKTLDGNLQLPVYTPEDVGKAAAGDRIPVITDIDTVDEDVSR
jgi:hypothetical protein